MSSRRPSRSIEIEGEDQLFLGPRGIAAGLLHFESQRFQETRHRGLAASEILGPEGAEIRAIITMRNTDDGLGVVAAIAANQKIATRFPEAVLG